MASNNGGVPPGFRFHPTDEELLHYYLRKKISFQKFDLEVIREVDLNKIEPWDLQERCRIGSAPQNEWYFFSHKDRKYPTGSRTNRATNAGFWKATGRDKCIRNSFKKIGMRKTLVFYRGRAPHGQKTDWIMHEYRLEDSNDPPSSNEDGWVVCRVFKKKNLFKLGEGSSSSTNGSALTQQLNNQPIPRNNNPINTTHQYLQHNQTPFHLYKPKLSLHHYSHIPDSHHHHHQHSYQQPHANLLPQLLSDHQRDCDEGSESLAGAQVQQYQACHEAATAALELGSCDEEASAATQQLMVGPRDHQEGLSDWAMLDRLVTPVVNTLGHDEESSGKGAVRFVNGDGNAQHQQLSLRGEMDFWGYAK